MLLSLRLLGALLFLALRLTGHGTEHGALVLLLRVALDGTVLAEVILTLLGRVAGLGLLVGERALNGLRNVPRHDLYLMGRSLDE